MDSKKFEILMTAVNLGSFSKASEVVGYTQSGLTHLINGLEREIGMKLIRRDHSGISLTEDGEALLPAIREGEARKPDRDHHAKADGDDPNRRLCEPCHALDAGNSVPLPPRVSGDRRGSSHGGPRARTL